TWDAGAGLLLVQEAGGVITDLEGRPYAMGGGEVLASNGLVHRELLDLVAVP
ncbi:inositol monophosphatase, partial [bacterium]|nr:inositol monophosphatase [bacterium]